MLLRGRARGSGLRHGHREHYELPTWLEAAGTRIVLHALKTGRNQKTDPHRSPPERTEGSAAAAGLRHGAALGRGSARGLRTKPERHKTDGERSQRERGGGGVRAGVGTVPCGRGRTDGRADGPPKSSASGSSGPPAAFTPRPERRESRRRRRRETRGRPRAAPPGRPRRRGAP